MSETLRILYFGSGGRGMMNILNKLFKNLSIEDRLIKLGFRRLDNIYHNRKLIWSEYKRGKVIVAVDRRPPQVVHVKIEQKIDNCFLSSDPNNTKQILADIKFAEKRLRRNAVN